MSAHLHTAIAHDFADATQAEPYGMAVALGLCFLLALRYPRSRSTPRTADAASGSER